MNSQNITHFCNNSRRKARKLHYSFSTISPRLRWNGTRTQNHGVNFQTMRVPTAGVRRGRAGPAEKAEAAATEAAASVSLASMAFGGRVTF
eukprot:766515-Hanusia_phi.AAC.7